MRFVLELESAKEHAVWRQLSVDMAGAFAALVVVLALLLVIASRPVARQ